MRGIILPFAMAATVAVTRSLPAQNTPTAHNSAAAVALVLRNSAPLGLNQLQVDRLIVLEERFIREETRLVRTGWFGAPGKARFPRYARIRVAPQGDAYTETRDVVKVLSYNRVPGKLVPRLARIPVVSLIDPPCPFAFLAGEQVAMVHELLSMR
jgi:hypothetical protein